MLWIGQLVQNKETLEIVGYLGFTMEDIQEEDGTMIKQGNYIVTRDRKVRHEPNFMKDFQVLKEADGEKIRVGGWLVGGQSAGFFGLFDPAKFSDEDWQNLEKCIDTETAFYKEHFGKEMSA